MSAALLAPAAAAAPGIPRGLPRSYRRALKRCAVIVAQLRSILLTDDEVLSDASCAPEWMPLAAMCALEPDDYRGAERLRDEFHAIILPAFRDEKEIRVAYARILSLLGEFLWIHAHRETPDAWLSVAQIRRGW